VDDHLVAVLVQAGGVAAEDDGQPILADAHALQRPQVMVVERGGLDGDRRPAVGDGRLGVLTERQALQRVVGVGLCGGYGEHVRHITSPSPPVHDRDQPGVAILYAVSITIRGRAAAAPIYVTGVNPRDGKTVRAPMSGGAKKSIKTGEEYW
jgi:hypothetical protein